MSRFAAARRATSPRHVNRELSFLDRHYYLAYTAVFILFAIAAFALIFVVGRSLIWSADGMKQHYTFFVYIGQWLRDFLATGTLRQWEFSFGYGADVISTLATWIGEPFNLLSALCPPAYAEYLYQALIVVRLWLAGLTFSVFCRYHRRDNTGTLVGALCYAFCGFCLCWGALRHPMFLDAAFELPLVLFGADKVLRNENPVPFILSLALTFLTYFYFAYMIAIFLVLFCLLRFFFGGGPKTIRRFVTLVLRFVGFSLVSLLLASALLLPIVTQVVQMDRISQKVDVPALFEEAYYSTFVSNLLGAGKGNRGLR